MENLRRLAAGLREPADYFAGAGGAPWCWPLNLIAFTRKTRRDLQRRTFESRLHTRYVLVTNLETAGTLNLDSTPYRLRPGECHLIFPHQLHTYHDVDREDILWLFVTFELPDATPLRTLRQAIVPLDPEMRRMLGIFLDAYRMKKNSPHRLQGILSSILLHMVQSASHIGKRIAREPRTGSRFLETIHRHHARHLPDALSVDDLARMMKISESHLRSMFRKTFGLSLGAYLRNLRLQEAVAMLHHSEASITDTALSCGFDSSSAFSRAFRNWSGMTPRKFRKSLANQA